jgi:NAD(P) transhydrogenase
LVLFVDAIGEHATDVINIGLTAMLAKAGVDVVNRACFNYPTQGEFYKYATYDPLLQREGRVNPVRRSSDFGERASANKK